ncbi:MAG: hypothetical protein CMJ70_25505 [Planctomycetaceae bacterium]|nr:hypothetical protein [Planctomycetaceae bacterium]HAA71885.1 hypothetical protein [Planctomycetaceae bacterium]
MLRWLPPCVSGRSYTWLPQGEPVGLTGAAGLLDWCVAGYEVPGLRLTTIWAMNAQTIKNTTLSAV